MRARALLKEGEVPTKDAAAIEEYFDLHHDWTSPGLALFSCAPKGFMRAFQAAVSFRNRVRISDKPHLKPLAHLFDHYAHFGVVVIDRIGARVFEYHLGELQATDGTMGEDVRKLKHGRGTSRGGAGSSASGARGGPGARHEEEVALRNMRAAAEFAQQFFAKRPIKRLFLAGTAENVAQFRELLPRQLQSLFAGSFPLEMTAGEHEVREKALALLLQNNYERERRLVETMITAAAKGGNAVLGLETTLRTVNEGRVQTLVVSDGFRFPGYVDGETRGLTAVVAQNQDLNGGAALRVEDVVEAAVARTIEQGGYVELISDNAELERIGRIGAILRY
jgi:peptide subunit release factor 1 (eRF1)